MAAGVYDLTTLAAAKSWLGIPDATTAGDVLIQSLISSASRYLLNYLSRGNILSQTYVQRFSGTGWGQRELLLPCWPVTSVAALSDGMVAIPAASAPVPGGQPPSGFLLEPWDGIPAGKPQSLTLYGYGFSAGAQNIGVTYTAGYLVSAEAGVIPSVDPRSITPAQPYGAFAADAGVVNATTALPFVKVASAPAQGQYSVSAAGVYSFNSADGGTAVLISYSYVPLDLAQACAQMVGEQYTYRSRIGVASKTLGGQETMTYSQKNLTPDLVSMLQNYKNVIPYA